MLAFVPLSRGGITRTADGAFLCSLVNGNGVLRQAGPLTLKQALAGCVNVQLVSLSNGEGDGEGSSNVLSEDEIEALENAARGLFRVVDVSIWARSARVDQHGLLPAATRALKERLVIFYEALKLQMPTRIVQDSGGDRDTESASLAYYTALDLQYPDYGSQTAIGNMLDGQSREGRVASGIATHLSGLGLAEGRARSFSCSERVALAQAGCGGEV